MTREQSGSALYLLAGDLMTSPAIVAPETATVRDVARLMLAEDVGGVPIVSASGAAIGMASDGDLLGRRTDGRSRSWWLKLIADGDDAGLAKRGDISVREVMSAPLIGVSPRAPVQDIAEALQAHRIKRLPVVEAERALGVISRADLLCVVESIPRERFEEGAGAGILGFLESLIGGASLRSGLERPPKLATSTLTTGHAQRQEGYSAEAFRNNVRMFKVDTFDREQRARREAELDRRRQIKALLDHHVSGQLWREMLEHAELAARGGEAELMLLRFPSDLCSDGGRKIDVAEPGWEETLRGEAAEIYDRWRKELKPRGFGLSARIVSYEDGIIGDIGLYLTWGE
ncbi:MAG TPA: CBS domain-containing protein [Roseiarcus sp.]|nr:CBS domain-containing protein [Roseiarcus sp.]